MILAAAVDTIMSIIMEDTEEMRTAAAAGAEFTVNYAMCTSYVFRVLF